MKNSPQHTQLGWFLSFRLAAFVILFAAVVIWLDHPQYLQVFFVVYASITLGFVLLLASERYPVLQRIRPFAIGLQFLSEIVLESAIVYTTGNVSSPFSGLFILTIVSASLHYRLVGTLLWASLVSLAYSFIIWFGLEVGVEPILTLERLQSIFTRPGYVFNSVFLHIVTFYLVAFISGYLAERLKDRDKELAAASAELRQARLETDDILRHLNSGLLTVNASGRVMYFNRAAERILGYREEEVRGLHCEEVFAERMPELAASLIDGITGQVEYPRKELEIIAREGKVLPMGLSTSILTDQNQELRGIIAIFSDLTEAKLLEAKVRAADRLAAIGELSASIAHEIRNPLAAISGSVEVLSRETEATGENARLMNLIVKESERLNKILSDFLFYARIDRPAYNKVELCHLIAETLEILYHHEAYHPSINFRLEADESIIYVVGDEDLLKQLLLNLAVNACEAFGGKTGEITMRLAVNSAKGTVEFYIQDNGPGIHPDKLRQIYKPFYSTKKQGTGLGLSIVHRICSILQLSINVDSQLGEGTTFLIELKTYDANEPGVRAKTVVSSGA